MTEAALDADWGPLQRGPSRPLILGHRGARTKTVENTLAAFELSRLDGADGTEFDVQLSADGVAFVAHDADLVRVSDGALSQRVARTGAAELDQLTLPNGEKLPRLSAVLEWASQHGQLLNIELKSYAPESDPIARVVGDLLRSYPQRDHVVVSSFHPDLLVEMRQALPAVKLGLLYTAADADLPAQPEAAELGPCALHPQASLLDPPSPALLALAKGRPINTWTVNDVAKGLRIAPHVNALITDRPDLFVAAFAQAGD